MRLFRAELRRLFKRRVTRFMLILVLLALATIAVSFSAASHKIGPAQLAAAEQTARQNEAMAARQADAERAACEQEKQSGANSGRFPPDMPCEQIAGPPPGTFEAEWFLPYQFDFRHEFGIFIAVFAGILALFAFVVGASYVGAEWSTGGMMNLLLWRPKRLTVLFTKLGALLAGVLAIGVGLGALWTAAFWLIARYDGSTVKMTPGVWRSFALDGTRGIALVLTLSAVGFALASLGRHTAMALGAAVGVGVVSEIGLRIAVHVADVKFPDRYALSTYVLSWFQKEWKLPDYQSCNWSAGACEPDTLTLTWQDSALVFGIGAAAVLAAAVWTMRRRDIT